MPKNIIITGANGNLGTATVKKFLDEGYQVIAADHSGSHLSFAENNPLFSLNPVDLSDEKATLSFVQAMAAKYNKIDGVLMLAGGFAMGDISSTSGDDLKKMYALNFETAYFLARPVFDHMLKNGYGRLVFIGARPALKPAQAKKTLAYALSKSLLFKLAEVLNEEAKGKNVVASVVVPSTIDTSLNRKEMPESDPTNWVKPEQLAEIMEFICSEKGMPIREPVYKVYNNA